MLRPLSPCRPTARPAEPVRTAAAQVDTLEPRMLLSATPGSGSSLAYYGESGRLITPLDARGNRIADFSAAGYRNGAELPNVMGLVDSSRVETVGWGTAGDDDTRRIQDAIDRISAKTVNANGFRGVVQLEAGVYQINHMLRLHTSGVVLRGVGDGEDAAANTILRARGDRSRTENPNLIEIGTERAADVGAPFQSKQEITKHTAPPTPDAAVHTDYAPGSDNKEVLPLIVDQYVPVGATSFRVDDTSKFQAGDAVVVERPGTAAWISHIGMDDIPDQPDGSPSTQWSEGAFDQFYERTIMRIEGDRIFLDAPLMNAFDREFGDPDAGFSGGYVYHYDITERIENVGVEHIRGLSKFDSSEVEDGQFIDEDHAWKFVVVGAAQDVWVRNVTGQHFAKSTVHAAASSIRVTVYNARSEDPVSEVRGMRRYPFLIDGQFVLMQNLHSENGRHDFATTDKRQNRGPNVFLNARAVDSLEGIGPHQKWATGTLYDTVRTDGLIEARNRGNKGSGHGWAGANLVFWNNTADEFVVQSPPTAQNWVIGSRGTITEEDKFGVQENGIFREHGSPIDFGDSDNPLDSLYVAQRNQREADDAAGYESREYVLGDFDLVDFKAGGVDKPSPLYTWKKEAEGYSGDLPVRWTDWDQGGDGQKVVPLTFFYDLAPGEQARAAVLSVGLEGRTGNSRNDKLLIDRTGGDAADPHLRAYSFRSLGLTEQLPAGDTTVLTFELTGADLIAMRDGRFNFGVMGESIVDWAVLDVTVDTGGAAASSTPSGGGTTANSAPSFASSNAAAAPTTQPERAQAAPPALGDAIGAAATFAFAGDRETTFVPAPTIAAFLPAEGPAASARTPTTNEPAGPTDLAVAPDDANSKTPDRIDANVGSLLADDFARPAETARLLGLV